MMNQEIKDLIRARGRVETSLVRIKTFVQQYDESQDVLYQLATVTYGTAPASFKATRCLNQLSSEEASSYPLAAEVISRDVYVDDLVTGSDSLSEARRLQEEIIHILGKGGFALHKLCANHADLIKGIPEQLRESKVSCNFKKYEGIKTLGFV
jgi:hypothetical protein